MLKGRNFIFKWNTEVVYRGDKYLDYNELERGCVFLVQLSRTFTAIFTYLKFIYKMMNLWHTLIVWNRYGWKYRMNEWKRFLATEEAESEDVYV